MRSAFIDVFRLLYMLGMLLVGFQVSQLLGADLEADDVLVTVSTDFPGGNVLVEKITGSTVHVAPDLRGDRPWFYWYFQVTAAQPGIVEFVLPEVVAGAKNGGIGLQGPAISRDAGRSWNWMGIETVKDNRFTYEFTTAGEVIRLAVTIPYLNSHLNAFLAANQNSPALKHSVLTTSRKGRDVSLLQIGESGSSKKPILITGRHHAAETIASYVLEGFLQAALSETDSGRKFREQYVLYAVPIVDVDGVEEGDQGKNRRPHDHNRDYNEESIYPEIRAIKGLDRKLNFQYTIDFHCPMLTLPDHQVMYFTGSRELPKQNFPNVSLLAERIKAGLPKTAPVGPLNWLRVKDNTSPTNARYFGLQEDVHMAVTLEFPFAPPGKLTDPKSCREYGAVILQAMAETKFIEPSAD